MKITPLWFRYDWAGSSYVLMARKEADAEDRQDFVAEIQQLGGLAADVEMTLVDAEAAGLDLSAIGAAINIETMRANEALQTEITAARAEASAAVASADQARGHAALAENLKATLRDAEIRLAAYERTAAVL